MGNFLKKENMLVLCKVLYALIIFLGAFLTFMFQPVTGKILTPQYGGGADIWAVCLLFFQFILFAGYLLALFLNKLKPKANAVIYTVLFVFALVLFKLPTEFGSWLINIGEGYGQNPLLSLFASLFKYAMLPVLVLSTVSVSMQNWYTKQTGESPYILYSISNTGSFLALFLYPLIYEPLMTTSATVKLWHGAFALLVALITAASFIYFKNSKDDNEKEDVKEKIQIKNLLYWISLSAAGTILLTSYTTYVTVKILPMPLLWTLFLGLYLLTFVLCFGSEKFYKKNLLLVLVFVYALANALLGNISEVLSNHPAISVLMTATIFFIFLMICNGEIYKTRPHPSRLSEFYLAIAFGGVLGGFFVNIIAPVIFNTYIELPLINVIMYLFAVYLFVRGVLSKKPLNTHSWVKISLVLVVSVIVGILSYADTTRATKGVTHECKRNFYGTACVTTNSFFNSKSVRNGSTLHGAQLYDANTKQYIQTPLTYYTEISGFGYVYEGMKNFQSIKKRPLNIGAIGLGAGTVASYMEKNDKITFYEIDPKMYNIAKNDFTYLKEAKGEVDVQMGDARIVLDKSKPQNFDFILVDAFSSDSIPVHLITKEAFDIYKKHIKEDGIIVFHTSNFYLDLDKTLKKIADSEKLNNVILATFHTPTKEQRQKGYYKLASRYFIVFMPKNRLYKNFKNFAYRVENKNETSYVKALDFEDDEFLKPFTDDYSSLVRIFKFWNTETDAQTDENTDNQKDEKEQK